MFVFKAAVVGAGTMGGEIAHAIASAGIPVVLKDTAPGPLDVALARATALWEAQVADGKLAAEESERRQALVTPGTTYEGFGDVDFVIEAVPEQIELKQQVFSELDEATPGHAILASNTSALSISEIGEATMRPEQVVGFHFFFPVSRNRLIEVTAGDDTAAETVQAAVNFAQAIRKTPIRCNEAPGFVVNRVLNAGVTELWRAQEQSGLAIDEFDRRLAETSPSGLGPFYIADLIGLDTCVSVAEYMQASMGERFGVHDGMRALVADGHLGAKTGKGFYEHSR